MLSGAACLPLELSVTNTLKLHFKIKKILLNNLGKMPLLRYLPFDIKGGWDFSSRQVIFFSRFAQ